MNKFLRFGLLVLGLQFTALAHEAQRPSHSFQLAKEIPTLQLQTPNLQDLAQEDLLRDKQGVLYRIGVAIPTHLSPQNAGLWTSNPDGSRTWQIIISAPGAEAISYLFEQFVLHGGSSLRIQNLYGQDVHPLLTSADVEVHQMQNAALCGGTTHLLTLTEPAYTTPSELYLDRIMYNYRSTGYGGAEKINESDPCEVNVNCSPVGDPWQDEKRGVARIYVVEGNQAGWCSGSLVNNTAQDCKPYFLTALHCGVNATASNMNQWKFFFRYEAPTCTNPTIVGTLANYFISGCLRIADSGDSGGNSGSDFLLVRLGNTNNENNVINNLKSANFNAYWNGWNASPNPTTGGASIHHPAGDIKKISTFTGNTISTQGGSAAGSHWRVNWTANTNGHGVTEGGSSGSPLFDGAAGYIIGTLTGGASYCTSPNAPDQYGKMSFHWTANGTTSTEQLKPWLDPANQNILVFGGSADPCNPLAGPCTASAVCDEHINTVSLNTINNSSACGNNGYTDFTNISTSLAKGNTYTLTITPAILNNTQSIAYTDDEIAAWIDFNNDFDFNDPAEQVAYVLVGSGWTNTFNVTIPLTAQTGQVRMRVRISYQPDGAITPCGPATFGETEDYSINITSGVGIDEHPLAQVQVYPNPANEVLFIDLKDLENVNSIALLDVNGKQIQELTNVKNGLNTFQIEQLAAGIYQVRINQDGYQITQRVVKL
ncbi:MAG: GEVED domain-containing protein [Flavobacteriales bacterium]